MVKIFSAIIPFEGQKEPHMDGALCVFGGRDKS
jgi:hypothetical protein